MRYYERLLWPVVCRLDAETCHVLSMRAFGVAQRLALLQWVASRLCVVRDPRLQFTWRGLTFPSPLGLAAGADKDAQAVRFMSALGFGFVEVGTVTPEPQPGNPKPREFRLPARRALFNSLGFPSQGARRIAERLAGTRAGIPLGVNIGKNAWTPLEQAAADYLACLERLYPYGDYFVVNVSSPNTPGLSTLQAGPALTALMGAVVERRAALAAAFGQPPKPLLVKLSPDLSRGELDAVLEVVGRWGVEGIVAVNTSADPALKGSLAGLPGGISGEPLRQRALDVVGYARRHGPAGLFIIGAGGVFDERDAWALLRAGANAVQMYTAIVYRGLGVAKSINRGLLSLLEKAEIPSIQSLAA